MIEEGNNVTFRCIVVGHTNSATTASQLCAKCSVLCEMIKI